MQQPRIHACGVLLPNGKVVVVGGMSKHGHVEGTQIPKYAILHAEMYDPNKDTWTLLAAQQKARVYHATAILLPDGRVISMGSNPHSKRIEHSIETYTPPYLCRGDRPVVTEAPKNISYGQPFTVSVNNSKQIGQTVLMRPEVLTHVTNTDQRLLELNFRIASEKKLEIEAPANAHHMPQGYCMLFVLNKDGVPSVSKFLQVN